MFGQVLVAFVLVVPLIATLVFAFLPERKESPMMHKRWRVAFVVAAVVYTAIAWWQIRVSANEADRDRQNAIRETSERVAKEINQKNEQTISLLEERIKELKADQAAAQKTAALANEQLQKLISKKSGETKETITRWRSDTETAVSKIMRPPRTLTIEQRKIFVRVLKTLTPNSEIAVRHSEGNDESQQYADQLISAMKEAGWKIKQRPKFLMTIHESYGVLVVIHDTVNIPPEAEKLVEAFSKAGIQVQSATSDTVDAGAVDVYVGLQ